MKNLTASCARGRFYAALLLLPFSSHAANVDWDGNGDANASGAWETDVNWNADTRPGVSDNARLLDVTSGTREVTIGEATTINKLTITQTTVGAVNVLNIDEDLTISGNSAPFAITATAGQDSIVTNIAAGKTLFATNAGSLNNVSFGSILNLAAGSVFAMHASGATSDITSPVFGGAINASGADALISFKADRNAGNATFNGAVTTTGAGSSLTIRRLNASDVIIGMSMSFNGDDGSGNAVAVGTGAVTNIQVTNSTLSFNNRVTVAGTDGVDAAGVFSYGAAGGNGTVTANFNDGVVLGEGALLAGSHNGLAVTLGGTSTFAEGSEFRIQYLGAQGTGTFTQTGDLTMTGADLNFDWAAPTNNTSTRSFSNTGTWTLRDGSTVAFTSSTGRSTSGFGVGASNNNSGVMNVESGSTIGFGTLFNTGTLNLGSSTGGVSDAMVILGSPASTFSSITLTNGTSSTNVDAPSEINILGDAFFGRDAVTGGWTTTLQNGTATSTGSALNIGDGTNAPTFIVGNSHVVVANAAGNTVSLNAGATFRIKSTYATATNAGTVAFNNSGVFNHSGTLQFQGNYWGSRTFANDATSTYRISGQNARLEALAGNTSGTNILTINFTSSGLITGSSAHDKLSYVNSSGRSSEDRITLTVTDGEITPGNGTNGTGATSVGQLEFSNLNISLAGTTKLSFDIGGLGNDDAPFGDPFKFDYLLMEGLTFNIGDDTGSVLDIWMVNGFVTSSEQSYVLVDATGGSVSGSFSSLLFQGEAVTDQYSVTYLSDRLVITIAAGVGTPVPEPSAAAILAGLGVIGFSVVRRRRAA